mgnify:CR=1 FL=1
MSSFALYDTLSRTTRPFIPLKAGEASIYLCGATVQASPHIGHLRSAINSDTLQRWLVNSGYTVTFIRNVTAIDDKILQTGTHADLPWRHVEMK